MTHACLDDRPRVLVLDEEVPFPPNSGKRIRTFQILSRLANDFGIDLLVHKNGATPEALDALRARGIQPQVAPSRVPPKSGLLFPARLLLSVFSALPYSVRTHRRRAYQAHLDLLDRQRPHALIHCEWTPYAVYRRPSSRPWTLTAHNIEHDIWTRFATGARTGLERTFFRLQAEKMRRFEERVFRTCPCAVSVSEEDASRIRGFGCPRVAVVPNGVDTGYFSPSGRKPEPRTLAFTGALDWRPNQDAVLWFIREIHPSLRRSGSYRLLVVGRNPPAWMRDPGRLPREIEVTGTVDDVRPFIERAEALVVPLRIGGGSRLKILEALALEKPVISTRVGAEGLWIRDGVHFIAADDPRSFAERARDVLASPERFRHLGANGRRLVCERYDWSNIAAIQRDLWSELLTPRSQATPRTSVCHAKPGKEQP